MPLAHLSSRAVVAVTGADARSFLQSLVTCDIDALKPGEAAFGALLTPQGKILFDFFVVCADDDRFVLDIDAAQAPALVKRLALYKLRAKVAIVITDETIVATWGGDHPPLGLSFNDPRDAAMGSRSIVGSADGDGDSAAYDAHRIACGVPDGGTDFAWGDAFPHEANMDLLNGVSFTKGCYVGQEVVSRTQHRGTARRRILRATFAGSPPAPGTEIRAGDIALGTVGSAVGAVGLVAVRTDRAADAVAAGVTPMADGIALSIEPLPS